MNPDANGGDETAELLRRCSSGDAQAYDTLFAAIYADLHLRARHLARGAGATLSTTALVHETYLKLAGRGLALNDRAHFFALAAGAMRQVLLNGARDALAQKRGGGMKETTFDGALAVPSEADDRVDMIALDHALQQLAATDARLARVVELHFFAGLGFAEVGELLGLAERTIARDWRAARALLQMQLEAGERG
ncbi:ECF-type sigma factor [Dokdonella sp.]|uniref:ECF-type sigma factor n=1 Tax=Dokdonella sp. TaxID=2291710 RepID=UPI003783C9FB